MRKLLWISVFIASVLNVSGQTAPDPAAEARKAINERLRAGDLDGARDVADKASKANPNLPDLWTALGRMDYLRGDFQNAEMEFKTALQRDPKAARAWVGLGMVFEAASLREKAKICFLKAYQENPRDPQASRYYGRTLTGAQRLERYEEYLANVTDEDDPQAVAATRQAVTELKALDGKKPFTLSSPLAATEVKLSYLMFDANKVRGFAIPVSINGSKPLRLMMDTGAQGILIKSKAAAAMGLENIGTQRVGGLGDEGERSSDVAIADRVTIGGVEFTSCPIIISDKKSLDQEDGLVGPSVFDRFLVTIDLQKMVLRLDPLPPHKTPPKDEDWQDREVAAQFSSFSPFWHVGHYVLLPTRVSSARVPNAQPVLFLVDTGSSTSLIDPNYARQFASVGKEDLVRLRGVSGKAADVEGTTQLTFEFGHYRQPVPRMLATPLQRMDAESPRMTGIFGITTLSSFRIQIDYRDGLINLEYNGQK
jgi:predicted aspartyl protease